VAAELRKPGLWKLLHGYAFWRSRTPHGAVDLVSAALLRTVDPDDRPWIPAQRSLKDHLLYVIRQVWDGERRKIRREIPRDPAILDETLENAALSADQLLDRHRSLALWDALAREVEAALAGDRIATLVLHHGRQDLTEPAELAIAMGCPVEEVYAAIRKVKYHARRVYNEWEVKEEQRMRALRERAAKGKVGT
jgi:DNA-directed RNA polymerase specialized sigma24 family protein